MYSMWEYETINAWLKTNMYTVKIHLACFSILKPQNDAVFSDIAQRVLVVFREILSSR